MINKIIAFFVVAIIACSAWYLYKMPKEAAIVVKIREDQKVTENKVVENKPQEVQKQSENKPVAKTENKVSISESIVPPTLEETQQQVDRNSIRLNEHETKIGELDNRVTVIENIPASPPSTIVVIQPQPEVVQKPVAAEPIIQPAYTEQELLTKLNITGLNKILIVSPQARCATFSRVGKLSTWGNSEVQFNGETILTSQGAFHSELNGWRDWTIVSDLASSTPYSYKFIYQEQGRQNTVLDKSFTTKEIGKCE